MSKILELRQKRSDVWDKAKAFLDERSGENGLMSGEDTATVRTHGAGGRGSGSRHRA